MQSYFCFTKPINNCFIFAKTTSTFHHLKNVMRSCNNARCIIVHEQSRYLCELQVNDNDIKAKIVLKLPHKPFVTVMWVLFFPLLKNHYDEYIIQKATELGVNLLVPVNFSRSVVKIKPTSKIDRWKKIVFNASQQSQRVNIPEIKTPINFVDIKNYQCDWQIAAYEKAPVIDQFATITKAYQTNQSIAVLIGPEGGLDENEIKMLKTFNFHLISLGHNILRSDTAAVYLLSLIKAFLQV